VVKHRVKFVPLLLAFFVVACSPSGSDGPAADLPDTHEDIVAADTPPAPDDTVDATEDQTPADLVEPIEVLPTTLNKGPWLQWVTPEKFHVMAESADEVPLVFEVYVEGALHTTVTSQPFKPDFSADILPLPSPAGWMHWAQITGVAPGEAFEILVLNTQDTASGLVPAIGMPVNLVLFGDTRTNDEAHQMVVNAIRQEAPALVLHSGDLMASGAEVDQWQRFFEIEADLLANTFFYPIFGNHEAFGQPYFDTFFHTEGNFKNERNWSTIWGDFGFLGMEIYTTDWSETEALAWLDQELSKLRENALWVIVAFHEPMYTFSNHGPWNKGREHVLPLLEYHQVDLLIAGHNHCYEHFLVNGIHHIVSGGGGAPLYGSDEGPPEEQDLLVMARKDFHYVRVDMQPEQITLSAVVAETGEVFDTWTIPETP